MGRRGGGFECDAQEALARQRCRDRGRQILGHDDRRLEQTHPRARKPGELAPDAIADIHDVGGSSREKLVAERAKLVGDRCRRARDRGDGVDALHPDTRGRGVEQIRVARHHRVREEHFRLVGVSCGGDLGREALRGFANGLGGGEHPGDLGFWLGDPAGRHRGRAFEADPWAMCHTRRGGDTADAHGVLGGHDRNRRDESIRAWTITAPRSAAVTGRIRVPGDRIAATDQAIALPRASDPPPAARNPASRASPAPTVFTTSSMEASACDAVRASTA